MFGSSDSNRSEGPGGCREALSTKAVRSEDTTAGRQTGREAEMWAKSVLGSAKSNRHRKTHLVEPGGTGQKFVHLTRGDLRRENAAEVSRGHSSADRRGNTAGAKGRRSRKVRSTGRLRPNWREELRNDMGVATTAATRDGAAMGTGWMPGPRGAGRTSQGLGEERK
jgi:hypothetical protein